MAVIFHTSEHFILRFAVRNSVCDFDKTVNFLTNDSQMIAKYAEVLRYTANLICPKKIYWKLWSLTFLLFIYWID